MDLTKESEKTEKFAKEFRQRVPMNQEDYEFLIHKLDSLVFDIKYKIGIKKL